MWTKPGPPVIPGPVLRACLAREWGLPGAAVAVHDGGMNSATWLVRHGTRRWVAKAVVPAAGRAFAAGLAVAAALERAGVPAGAPVPGATGTAVVRAGGYPLALLTWVPGAPLGTGAAAQRLIGATLARVHRALAGVRVAGTERFHWVDRAAGHLAVRPWVRPAVTAAVRALAGLDPDRLTWGLLHTDPAPEAFRYDPATGTCGVIDWSTALAGPLLYDLASAVMYAGGPAAGTELVARTSTAAR